MISMFPVVAALDPDSFDVKIYRIIYSVFNGYDNNTVIYRSVV